jgi:uncharacterized phage protein (TIGR01671 family)
MRDIKFRAWDKKHNRFLGDDFLIGDDGKIFFVQFGNEIYLAVQEQYIIEQFTGLSDKNGKEIYEGDIIEDIKHEIIKRIFVVSDIRTLTREFDNSEHDSEWEIIGNIHENPELIK